MEEQSREVETRPPVLDGEMHLLLGDLKDEASGYRRREATWISLIVHAVFILVLIFMPKWMPNAFVIVPAHPKENVTDIFLPDDQLKVKTPPKTDIVSDKNRIKQSPTPQIDKETLRKLMDARKAGLPRPQAPPPQPQPQPQAAQQQPQPQPGTQVPPQPPTTETAKLDAPQPKQNPFKMTSPSASINQAIQAAANGQPSNPVERYDRSGERGAGIRPKTDVRGAMEIMSDTMGVDFGPYMKRLHVTVEDHWFPLIPEIALPPMMKRGRVVIEFDIMPDGSLQGLTVVGSSGDTALDRAAFGALQNSVPLPRLPKEFSGKFLRIRAAFYYNPDKNDFE
jgi:TonB family protein